MSLRVVFKYGLIGGVLITAFAFLKSEWFYSGLYPDFFITLIAFVFSFFGLLLRNIFRRPALPEEKDDLQARLRQLSKRELEVLELLSSRQTNKEIAEILHISLSTLKTHINSIYKKMDIKNRKELKELLQVELILLD